MQSEIEVDKEDLYILKINRKGKRTVGKAKKGIDVEKICLKKSKKRERKKKKENSAELQKPNVEAEVYNNNKKCDRGGVEKKLQKLN